MDETNQDPKPEPKKDEEEKKTDVSFKQRPAQRDVVLYIQRLSDHLTILSMTAASSSIVSLNELIAGGNNSGRGNHN